MVDPELCFKGPAQAQEAQSSGKVIRETDLELKHLQNDTLSGSTGKTMPLRALVGMLST